MNTAEKLPDNDLESQALTLYEQALQIQVVDQITYQTAGVVGSALKELREKIVAYHKPIKDAAHNAHKVACEREKTDLKPVDEALVVVRQTVNTYLENQERLRKEEERRLQLEAEEKARKEQEKLLSRAAKAEEKGQEGKAEALLEQAEMVYVPPVVVAPSVQTKTDNTTAQMETQITVTDMKAFIAEIVKRGIAPTMFDVKASPLKAWVKSNAIENFPGLLIKKVPAVRFK